MYGFDELLFVALYDLEQVIVISLNRYKNCQISSPLKSGPPYFFRVSNMN
jgi:hypothetical protein